MAPTFAKPPINFAFEANIMIIIMGIVMGLGFMIFVCITCVDIYIFPSSSVPETQAQEISTTREISSA